MQSFFKRFQNFHGNNGGESVGQKIDITIRNGYFYGSTQTKRSIPWINIILFLATTVSTLLVGIWMEGYFPPERITDIKFGVPYSFTLMAILTLHEFGHYIAARRYGFKATYPYFIPFPFPPIGTFGAIIKIKSPITNKRALLDIGAAGPIAGFIVAVPALYFGLQTSEIKIAADEGVLMLGDSLILQIMQYLIYGNIPPGYDVYLNSVGFAGWVGLLVTALNLLPLGQLDGGHILYALTGRHQHSVAKVLLVGLVILGIGWKGWWLWAILIYFMKFRHPPTADEHIPLDWKRKAVGIFCLIIFILCFIPFPLRIQL